jgi:hypothetical protein
MLVVYWRKLSSTTLSVSVFVRNAENTAQKLKKDVKYSFRIVSIAAQEMVTFLRISFSMV